MDRETKLGIIFILVGICIPIAVLPFVTGFSKNKGIIDNIYDPAIMIRKETPPDAEINPSRGSETSGIVWSRLIPKRIPWRFFLGPTLIFFYMGIVRIDRARRRKKGEYDEVEESNESEDQGKEPDK